MQTIKTLFLFIICMGIIVSIHEFGHLITAKIFGVFVKEYAIGMGPKLYSFKGKETEYSIRLLPLGGFCMMAGDETNSADDNESMSHLDANRTLVGIAKWKRAIIMFGGIFMNMVLALFIFAMIIFHNGSYAVSDKPYIVEVQENMPAYNSGLMPNDLIEKVSFENGVSISPSDYNELSSFLATYDGKGAWTFVVNRDGERKIIEITPVFSEEYNSYMVGISFSGYKNVEVNFFSSFKYGIEHLYTLLKLTIISVLSMFKGVGLENLSGPVGIYKVIEDTSVYGIEYYFEIIAILSANIGVINALPLPVFDGGRVILLLAEAIIGRPLNQKFENAIMVGSFALLLLLTILITYKDILNLF